MFSIQQKAARTAKRAGLVSAGAFFCLIGTGFLTLAAWFFFITVYTALQSALIIAAIYFGIGLLLLALGQKRRPSEAQFAASQNRAPRSSAPPLVQAFLYGLDAGSKAKRGSNRFD